jgi:FkbM family methyltransferase
MELNKTPADTSKLNGHPLLELRRFFEGIDGYVILKLSDGFPDYDDYSDIDVLCRNPQSFIEHVLKIGQSYAPQGIRAELHQGTRSVHVDFYAPGASRLNFRFDVFGNLAYDNVSVRPGFAEAVLASARPVNVRGVPVYVPTVGFDLAVRFLEYLEHRQNRPDKVKHWEYVKRNYHPDFMSVAQSYMNLESITAGSKEPVSQSPAAAEPCIAPGASSEPFYRMSKTCQIPDLHAVYEKYFGRRTDGCFVEVGAFDGEYVSNTSGLADKGWKGFYIEPVPAHAEKCRARHAKNPNVTVTRMAIGAVPDTVEISVAGPLSTINESAKQNFRQLNWAKGYFDGEQKVSVRQLPLHDFLVQQGVKPGFELLVVDVEGYEWEVFRNFDIEAWHPQMVIVELHDQNDDYLLLRQECNNLVRYFSDHRYKPVFKDSSNTIYISSASPVPASRMDFFMIWGHGLAYTREILQILRGVKDFEIVSIIKRQVKDIAQFVHDVYSCDSFPMEHLVAKTRYLLTTPPEILLILLRNKNPQEVWKGEGAFRRRQCMLVKEVKEAIRNRFNPRKNGKRTEDHVVHASDFESQVEHVLNVLGLPDLSYYTRRPNAALEAPFHLEPFEHYEIRQVPIDDLRANILDAGRVPIEQTPHYHFLTGDRQAYERYYLAHLGTRLTEDHFPEAFDRLVSNFNYDFMTPEGRRSLILARRQPDGTYRILDGVHRAAILKFKGIQTVTIAEPVENTAVLTPSVPALAPMQTQRRPVISMSTLGSFGRFGNQLFQYLFLRLYAQRYDLAIETPEWIGRTLFGCSEPPISRPRPLMEMPNSLTPFWLEAGFDESKSPAEVDFKGYFQYHTRYYAEHKAFIRSLFRPVPPVESVVRGALEKLRRRGKTLVGLHLRRGDFGRHHHFVAPAQWYKDWLNGFWETLEEPVLFVASDEPETTVKEFAEFNPFTGADLGVDFPAAPFYVDFYILSHCDAVAVSNSTFSFLACMLNEKGTIFVRPRLSCRKMIPFDPWNSPSNFKDEKVEQTVSTPAAASSPVPMVSVLMAVHNGRAYLPQALESLYLQTCQDFELIIVDDASTDDTPEILNRLKDTRTIIHRNPANLGLTRSLNIGLRLCRGQFVARMDADDLSLPRRFARQVEFLQAHPDIAMVGSAYYRIDAQGKTAARIDVPTDDAAIRQMMQQKCAFGHGTVMVRRQVLLDCGGYNERFTYAQDFDLWLRMSEQYKLANLGEPLYAWRSSPQCISNTKAAAQRSFRDRALQEAQQRAAQKLSPALSPVQQPRTTGAMPLVSVIVPTHNRPDSLKFAVASIVNQTYSNIEIIVVNDAGEPVDDLLRSLNLRGSIVSLRHDQNKGPAAARNTGLRAARGKYIAYLDDDDIYFRDHIQVLVAALEGSAYHVAHTQAQRSHQVKQDGRYLEVGRSQPYTCPVTHDQLLVRNLVPTLCIMHEKACIGEVGYFDETLKTHEDWDMWIRMSKKFDFLHIPRFTAQVTWRTDGTTTTSQRQRTFLDAPQRIYQKHHEESAAKPDVLAQQADRLRFLKGRTSGVQGSSASQVSQSPKPGPAVLPSGRKLRIAIKSCTESKAKCLWGDMWFAQGLQKALSRAGHECVIHCRDEWDLPDEDIDVAIHIKGLAPYQPKPHSLNIIWVISHPELHTAEELNRFDAVFCGSKRYLEHIRPSLKVPCFYLPQAADEDIFKPLPGVVEKDIDILFVGSNYYRDKNRRIIDDVLAAGKEYNLCIVGPFWENRVDARYIKSPYMRPEQLPPLYARAKIILNDHHETMRQWGFINDRTYTLAAMNLFQISDYVEGIEELGVVTYQTPEDLREKLDYYLANDAERQRIAAPTPQPCGEFTFANVAAQILETARLQSAIRDKRRMTAGQPERLPQLPSEQRPSPENAPKVSVIMACHNAEPYLAETMDSLLAQTLTDWELLALDDGSTDRTASLLEAYAQKDARIRLWRFDDKKGPYVRRNFAITQACAEFISIQDSDDIMAANKLEALYNQIASDPNLAIVGSFFRRFWETFRGEDFGDRMDKAVTHQEIMAAFPRTWHVGWHGSAIIRKSLFETIGFYDEQPYGSDTFWLSKAGLYGYLTGRVQFINLPRYLTYKREHAQSQTGAISPIDPRSRRHKLETYYLHKLAKIMEKAKDNPSLNVAAELKACTCTDFIPRFGSLFEQWESEPLDDAMCRQVIERAMSQFAAEQYVSCLMTLNGLEHMTGGKSQRWPNVNLTRGLAAYASGDDASAVEFLKQEIQLSGHRGASVLLRHLESAAVPKEAWLRRKEIRDYIAAESRKRHEAAVQAGLSDLAADRPQPPQGLAQQFLEPSRPAGAAMTLRADCPITG